LTDIGRIDTLLQQATARVPGLVALATNATGTLYEGAFGRRDLSSDMPMTTDSVFWLASMTKALTSVAAMQLVEQGRLALDAPIADILPHLATPSVLTGFASDGTPELRPATGPITLRQLLAHTSGYGYSMWNAELARFFAHAGMGRGPANWEDLARTPLLFDPGTRWNYSIATDIVGKAIETVTGQSLEIALHDLLLGPLVGVQQDPGIDHPQRARQARMHARQADGSLLPINFPVGANPSFMMGGGTLCGTAHDYGHFLRMVLRGGDGLLGPQSMAAMGRNQLGELFVEPMVTAAPTTSNDAEFFPGMPKKWGLGFLLNTAPAPTGRRAGSLTWAGLGNCYYWIDPQAELAGLILMQILPFADEAALDAFAAFETAVYEIFA
jgi:methyl acetate hydrolase